MMLEPRTMLIVDQGELQALRAEVRELTRLLTGAKVTPLPQWQPLTDYAARLGKSEKTIRNWVRAGKLETKREGSMLMIKSP
ncbi:hypothetical protein [Cypionkella sinensis]|uniref:Helix-turn-helix domain-containing protein n=1 Tax=Cypionkella sinensis TaxID=1756043 RepID=A0ABV7IXJ6_9RHOB